MSLAVVTGAASGFGLAVATQCAARGMDVALLDYDGERVTDAGAALAAAHGWLNLESKREGFPEPSIQGRQQQHR